MDLHKLRCLLVFQMEDRDRLLLEESFHSKKRRNYGERDDDKHMIGNIPYPLHLYPVLHHLSGHLEIEYFDSPSMFHVN